MAWKATGSSEDRNLQLCLLFLLCAAGQGVPSFGRRCQLSAAGLPILFLIFFSLFLRGPCPITFFSASLLFLLQLPLLWPVSQQLSCWNSQCAGTTKDRFPKAEPQSGFDSSFDNFFFTNTTVTACSFFRSLKVNLRDAFWILGRQLNWNNCWQVVWKGCLSSGVIGFSKGGCVGWSVTAVSHTTNSFFSKGFFFYYWFGRAFQSEVYLLL